LIHFFFTIMHTQDHLPSWDGFRAANRFRRAIRDFGSTPIKESDIVALLDEARYAPSSGNLQPYAFHWIRDADMKKRVAAACNGQKAAASASELIVLVASPDIGKKTAAAQLAYVDSAATLDAKSKQYHRQHIEKFLKILGIGAAPFWTPLLSLAALIRPALSLQSSLGRAQCYFCGTNRHAGGGGKGDRFVSDGRFFGVSRCENTPAATRDSDPYHHRFGISRRACAC